MLVVYGHRMIQRKTLQASPISHYKPERSDITSLQKPSFKTHKTLFRINVDVVDHIALFYNHCDQLIEHSVNNPARSAYFVFMDGTGTS